MNHSSQVRFVDVLEPGLEASDIFLDLLEEGKLSGQIPSAWDLVSSSAGSIMAAQAAIKSRIEHVIFGPAQMHRAKRLDLHRLQHQNDRTSRPQMLHHTTFITTGSLDPDALTPA